MGVSYMESRYAHLLSPFQVGNVVFRNRMFTAPMGLHALQGGELYPTAAIITHYANKAKGGAAGGHTVCGGHAGSCGPKAARDGLAGVFRKDGGSGGLCAGGRGRAAFGQAVPKVSAGV